MGSDRRGPGIDPIIDVAQLHALLESGRPPRLLDVRWALDGSKDRDTYREGHLPGAVYVDLPTELAGAASPAGTPSNPRNVETTGLSVSPATRRSTAGFGSIGRGSVRSCGGVSDFSPRAAGASLRTPRTCARILRCTSRARLKTRWRARPRTRMRMTMNTRASEGEAASSAAIGTALKKDATRRSNL